MKFIRKLISRAFFAHKTSVNQRTLFEAWAKGKTDHFRQDSKGVYVSHWTRCMWEAWQAAQEEAWL